MKATDGFCEWFKATAQRFVPEGFVWEYRGMAEGADEPLCYGELLDANKTLQASVVIGKSEWESKPKSWLNSALECRMTAAKYAIEFKERTPA